MRVIGRHCEGPRMRVRFEGVKANLDRCGAREKFLRPQTRCDLIRLLQQLRFDARLLEHIDRESLFFTDGLGHTTRLDRTIITPVTQLMPLPPRVTKERVQITFARLLKVSKDAISLRVKRLRRNRTDSPHALDRKWRESRSKRRFIKLDKRIGLLEITGDLRGKLVRRDSH